MGAQACTRPELLLCSAAAAQSGQLSCRASGKSSSHTALPRHGRRGRACRSLDLLHGRAAKPWIRLSGCAALRAPDQNPSRAGGAALELRRCIDSAARPARLPLPDRPLWLEDPLTVLGRGTRVARPGPRRYIASRDQSLNPSQHPLGFTPQHIFGWSAEG